MDKKEKKRPEYRIILSSRAYKKVTDPERLKLMKEIREKIKREPALRLFPPIEKGE